VSYKGEFYYWALIEVEIALEKRKYLEILKGE
jgi:hypothetical protein